MITKKKEEMLTILRNSVIYFDKTSSFATRSWQYWENIDLRVPIPLLKEARNLQKNLQDIASMVYIETDDYDFNQLNIKPKPIDLDIDNYKEHDAFFSEIKDTIIQGIRNAKYLIWCAVAWITDDDIYNELLKKRNNGIQIRILTSDEPSNSRLLKNLCDNFEVVKIPQWGENSRNRMHDKCKRQITRLGVKKAADFSSAAVFLTLGWQLIRPRKQRIQLLCVYISFIIIICKLWQLRKKILHIAVNVQSIQLCCFDKRIDHRTCSCSTHGIDQYPVLPADCERTNGSLRS